MCTSVYVLRSNHVDVHTLWLHFHIRWRKQCVLDSKGKILGLSEMLLGNSAVTSSLSTGSAPTSTLTSTSTSSASSGGGDGVG